MHVLVPIALLFALVAVGLSACEKPASTERSRLILDYMGGSERCFTPSVDGTCKHLLFAPLAKPSAEGKLEGRLARSWEHSLDYRTWTIHLRSNVRWHDGVPFTAHDVKFTYELLMHPEVQFWTDLGVESITVIDDSTYTITHTRLPEWDRYWYPGVWMTFYPKHLLKHLNPAQVNEWEFWKHPVGNGPFRFVRMVPSTAMVLEANPDYYRGRPQIDEVVLNFGPSSSGQPDPTVMVTRLLAGEVDVVNLERDEDAALFQDDPRFRIYYEAWDDVGGIFAVLWNRRHPPLEDAKVRRALTLATDREALRGLLHSYPGLPIVDAPYSEWQYWHGDLPAPIPYDPDEARRLLDEAEWRDTDGDGMRERDGVELAFTCQIWGETQRPAVWLQSQYARIGVQMEIAQLDRSIVRERVRDGDYEAAITQFGGWMPRYLKPLFGRETAFGENNPDAVELLDRLPDLAVPEEIDAVFSQLQPIFLRELPFTFLTLDVETFAAHRKVGGLSTPFRARATWHAEDLWIDEGVEE